MEKNIEIIHSHLIDSEKWNRCIAGSRNALIYADSRMLDALCDNWSALIVGNYETVLPLPWRRKFGIRYLYAPAFIQQLGFFGDLSSLNMQAIWKIVFGFAKYGDIFFNYQNKELLQNSSYTEKTNFVLDLATTYPSIHAAYSHDLIKNLQKSDKQQLLYSNESLFEKSIQLFQTQYQERFPQYNSITYNRFQELCLAFEKTGNCITRTAFDETGNEILATAILLKNNNRLSLLMNATTNIGRALAANHFLLDQIIQEFSEENILFDFEGSERKGIKEFYQSFHPDNQPYFHVSFNKLPSLINLIKNKFFTKNN